MYAKIKTRVACTVIGAPKQREMSGLTEVEEAVPKAASFAEAEGLGDGINAEGLSS